MTALMELPGRVWRDEETRAILRTRDIAALLRLASSHGASQSRIGAAIGTTQARVSEIINGSRMVTSLEVFERIADGMGMPDEARVLLGLAPKHPAGLDHLGAAGRAEILSVFPSQASAVAQIRADAAQASTMDILAVRGLGIIGLNDSLLRGSVRAGRILLRVLLLDPDSPVSARRAEEIGESTETFTAGIRLALAQLRELADDGPIEVYVYSTLPVWRVISLDDVMYVSSFGDEWEGHESAMYKLAATPYGALHRGIRRELEEVRRSARRMI
ncbi:helix-turn-helix domain-containing protein [Nocardiopsis sediminis]|uniref:Helix-turn-helix domain-containing protein n=1 Tax=Nocardiopsis sediminis TaxID=1778267 RepID=A0ABV8FEL7_9ACTN